MRPTSSALSQKIANVREIYIIGLIVATTCISYGKCYTYEQHEFLIMLFFKKMIHLGQLMKWDLIFQEKWDWFPLNFKNKINKLKIIYIQTENTIPFDQF